MSLWKMGSFFGTLLPPNSIEIVYTDYSTTGRSGYRGLTCRTISYSTPQQCQEAEKALRESPRTFIKDTFLVEEKHIGEIIEITCTDGYNNSKYSKNVNRW
jgi:hypothetical protein